MAALQRLWQAWKALGRFMGNLVGRVLLSVFYFTVFAPFGIGARVWTDPLQVKTRPDSLWRPRSTPEATTADAGRQF